MKLAMGFVALALLVSVGIAQAKSPFKPYKATLKSTGGTVFDGPCTSQQTGGNANSALIFFELPAGVNE